MIMINSKIRLRLSSFNHELLNFSCNKVIKTLQSINIDSFSVISLPTKKRIYCVLRSPHVDKDSREHFEIRVHKRILEIFYNSENNTNIINLLTEANISPGVFYNLTISN